MNNAVNPVLVNVFRGEMIESRHRGAAAVVAVDGTEVATWGDVYRPIYPRSSLKPIQALPLLESGAAERFGVTDEEIALASASHGGEPDHMRRVGDWLKRLGLGPGHLVCGSDPAVDESSAAPPNRQDRGASRLHHNCSGKHCGFLTTALHLGESPEGYAAPDHPVQRRWREAVSDLSGVSLDSMPCATDGCGIAVIAMPLVAIARAMARFADPSSLPAPRAVAAERIVAAMTTYPWLVGGTGHFNTRIIDAAAGSVVVKAGAEGVQAAILVGRGLGIAVKIDDGAQRGAETAMAAVLHRFADPDQPLRQALAPFLERPLINSVGNRVGTICPDDGWSL